MARYLQHQQLFTCPICGTQARREEFTTVKQIICPNCFHYKAYKQTECAEQNGVSMYIGIPGMFVFRYMGFGVTGMPAVIVQESNWDIAPCELCHKAHEINSCKIESIYNPVAATGLKNGTRLPGIDVVSGGGTFVLPFRTDSRMWVDGEEIDHMEYFDASKRRWEYFVQHQ